MNVKSIVKRFLIRVFSFGPPQKKVLFDSFGGTQYSADPRAISEKMHELYPEYEIVWLINNASASLKGFVPEYVRIVDGKLNYIKELATSCAYVTTEPLTRSFFKRKHQFVVQTWHGDRGIKKALYMSAESRGQIRERIYDDLYTDICVAGSDFGEIFYRVGFDYRGEIIKKGMPKNDKLVNWDEAEYSKVREKLSIPIGYKILLYAPTFRGNSVNSQRSQIDINRTLEALDIKGEKWVCLLRAHKYSKEIVYQGSRDRIIDVSSYPDMADLLTIADMLMTDYSSCAGDFAILKKPIILIVNDEEDYTQSSRQLRMNLEDTGFILSRSQDELEYLINSLTEEDYVLACDKVLKFYGVNETGHAASSVCERINGYYVETVMPV